MPTSKIFLIGMPGSGKSTLGKKLAKSLGLTFIDLDKEIEEKESMTIPDLFTTRGEDYFREVESELLKELASSSESFVLATGGGAPCFYNGIEVINKNGLSVFLDVALDTLLQRIQQEDHRPLLQSDDQANKLQSLLNKRLPVYKQATIHVLNDAEDSFPQVLAAVKARM